MRNGDGAGADQRNGVELADEKARRCPGVPCSCDLTLYQIVETMKNDTRARQDSACPNSMTTQLRIDFCSSSC